ncbi:hypothetical protein ABPG72_006586 [Tetrahymena utriculariae]
MNKKIFFLSTILAHSLAGYNYYIPDFPTSTPDVTCTQLKRNKELLAYTQKFSSTDLNFMNYAQLLNCHAYMDNTVRQECFKKTNNSSMPQEFQDLNNCELKNCYLHDWNTCKQQNQACKYCTDFKVYKNFQDDAGYQQADSPVGKCVTQKVAQSFSQYTDKNDFAHQACLSYQQNLCRKEWIKTNWDSSQFCQYCEIQNYTSYSKSSYLSIFITSLILFTLF